jgi:hypothetical protein
MAERPKQLVAVVLASPGDAHGFFNEAQRTGHDAYPESDPRQALRTLKTQVELYGFLNTVVVDVARFGVVGIGRLHEFSSNVREISPEVTIIGYSSKKWRGVQLRALTAFGLIDESASGQSVTAETVLGLHNKAANKRKPNQPQAQTAA